MGRGKSATTVAAAVLVVFAVASGACARDSSRESAFERRLAAARDDVAAASAEVEELRDRLASLEDEVVATARLKNRLETLSARFRKAFRKARDAAAAATSAAAGAGDRVQAAIAEAERATRDLEVLKDRYDYHLRRYHGGG